MLDMGCGSSPEEHQDRMELVALSKAEIPAAWQQFLTPSGLREVVYLQTPAIHESSV
jgi:hypothetical protein